MGKSLVRLLGFAAGMALSATVSALGMGGINVTSSLGQPLKAEIELVAVAKSEKSSLVARIAAPEIYKGAGLEYPYGNKFKFQIETRPNGEPYLKVTSVQPVNDPFVVMLVEVTWSSGRLMREYTFLLDPPGYAPEMPAQVQVQPVVPAVRAAVVEPTVPPIEKPVESSAASKPESIAVNPEPVAASSAVAAPEIKAAPETAAVSESAPPSPEAQPPADVTPSEEAAPATDVAPSVEAAPQAEVEAAPLAESAPAEQSKSAFAIEQVTESAKEPATAATRPESAEQNKEWVAIQRGDTAGKVSLQYKPADVSLERMLVALYRANSAAFDEKNMNRIRAGKILRLPSQEEIEAIGQPEAVREIRAQVADWNAYRQRLAGAVSVPAQSEEVAQVATGKIASSVADKTPVAKETAKEVLKLSKGEAPGDHAATGASGKSVSAQEKKNLAEEEAIAKAKAAADEQARAAILENNLKDMQRLAKLKSAAAALAQQSGVSGVAAASEVAPAKLVAPKPAPVQAEPSMVDQVLGIVMAEPLYLAGGAGLLLLLGLLGYMAKKRKGSPATKKAEKKKSEDSSAQAVRIAEPGSPSPESGDFTSMFAQQTDTNEQFDEADPISEADLFLNFGRDAQAEEILKEALQTTPNNHKIHLKLMEIYAKRKDLNSFGEMARQVIDSGDEQASQQAIAMGRDVDPDNSLFGGTGLSDNSLSGQGGENVEDAFAATSEARPTTVDFDVGEPSQVLGISQEDDFLSDAVKTVTKTDGQKSPEDDFLADATNTQVMSFDHLQSAPAGAIQVGGGLRETVEADGENPGALPQLDESTLDAVRNKFSLPITGVKPGKLPKSDDDSLMEFTLDLPEEVKQEQSKPVKAAAEGLAGISLDLDSIAPAKSAALSDEHIQEVATKLDLAKAYQEMGDASGAREILEEVLREGDDTQREAANTLIAQLG